MTDHLVNYAFEHSFTLGEWGEVVLTEAKEFGDCIILGVSHNAGNVGLFRAEVLSKYNVESERSLTDDVRVDVCQLSEVMSGHRTLKKQVFRLNLYSSGVFLSHLIRGTAYPLTIVFKCKLVF